MDVIRRWIFRPKRSDASLLAQFFYADRDLNLITDQLEKFDGHKNVEQFPTLLTELRKSQDSLLAIVEKIMDESIPGSRSSRDFRVKFPDDILQESLAGRLWFGAECLAAGSSIINHEIESMSMQPLAKLVTKQLGRVRMLLREQSLHSTDEYSKEIRDALTEFDTTFAEFELCYVSAMVPVKTMRDYDLLQDVTVLFNETVQRALRLGWLTQDQLDMYDPALMFTIPRMAVICGLLIYPEGPLNPDMNPNNMSEMFRPFQLLLHRIRDLLWTLDMRELWILEVLLSKGKDPSDLDDLTSFEDLGHSSCPWMDETYDYGVISKRARDDETSAKVTASEVVVDYNCAPEVGGFFEEFIRSCGCELQRNFVDASLEGAAMTKTDLNGESAVRATNQCSVCPNTSGEMACFKINSSNAMSYDASDSHRSRSIDPDNLSSQITEATCVPDCSSVEQISCECQETNRLLGLSLQHSCHRLSVPVQPNVTDEDQQLVKSSSDQKQHDGERHLEIDSAGISVFDSLEMSDSSAQRETTGVGYDWDRESYSNFISISNSLCCDDDDDEEAVKSAIEAAETSAREEMRSQFRDSIDLLHRLFICISGIADQLQSNFASDLRHILKTVFNCNTLSSEPTTSVSTKSTSIGGMNGLSPISGTSNSVARMDNIESLDRPRWIPDDESPICMSCQAIFTFMRRRHHCRNCGRVFCGQCSSNTVPLPHYGHEKPVRVCNHCFLFCVTPFRINV